MLKKIQDGDEIAVKDKKTLMQMEEAIEESIMSLLLDISKSSNGATRKPPHHSAKQASFHCSNMLVNKNNVEGWYKLALKEGRKERLSTPRAASQCKRYVTSGMKNYSCLHITISTE